MPFLSPTFAAVEPESVHHDRAECSAEFAPLGVSGLSSVESPFEEEDDGTVWITCHVCLGIRMRDGLTTPYTCGLCGGIGVLPQGNFHD